MQVRKWNKNTVRKKLKQILLINLINDLKKYCYKKTNASYPIID